ncbi:hypothetical protein SUGI_0446910 [Cryptomeria japonica]|uniref:uncharacterized protein LOC131061618 n=1 Tax=Cryptomeria japonica TaxID=3369 RepID=UPI002408B380|nr:uncharacterized protein LOC131061618 [Cryptomeria japonica]GLJ23599.1 hypothetical protein SUGI_0446910 [Cryptomeria japonica]
MASRAASRTVRSAFRSAGNPFRHAEGTNRSRPISFPARNGRETAIFRRRCVKSMIPLHDAVAAAKLVSHLSVSSRTCSALSLGLQSYVHAPFHALCIARGTWHLEAADNDPIIKCNE